MSWTVLYSYYMSWYVLISLVFTLHLDVSWFVLICLVMIFVLICLDLSCICITSWFVLICLDLSCNDICLDLSWFVLYLHHIHLDMSWSVLICLVMIFRLSMYRAYSRGLLKRVLFQEWTTGPSVRQGISPFCYIEDCTPSRFALGNSELLCLIISIIL